MSDKHVIREKLLVLDIPEQPLGTYLVVVTNGDGDIMYREQPDVIVDLGLQPASTITIQVMTEWNAAYDNMINGISFAPSTGDLTLTRQDAVALVANLDGRYLQGETDPVFSASAASGITSTHLIYWNYAYNKAISGVSFNTSNGILSFSQVDGTGLSADLDGRYLQSETDPIFSASVAAGITLTNVNNWNSAYNDTIESGSFNVGTGVLRLTQRDAGTVDINLDGRYLTSYTEIDPIFTASVAAGIISSDVSNWNTAFNNSIASAAFNAGTGDLTLTQQDAGTITANLDGRYYLASNPDGYTTNDGTVTSVDLAVPVGFGVIGNPITTSGTLTIQFATGYSLPSDAEQSNWDAAFGWGDHALAGYYLASNPAGYTTNDGTVTSVSVSTGTGLTATGSPITTSGTINIAAASGYSIPAIATQALWTYAYNKSISSFAFNSSTGELTISSLDTVTEWSVDLDGRYLQSYTETDPVFVASAAHGITSADIDNWELARIQTIKCDVTDGVASVGDNYTFRIPYDFKITEIRASATKAPVGANLTIRLYQNGSNLTDPARPLTIDDGDRTSTTSANNYVLLTTDLTDDDEIKVEITQVGSSSAGEEIKFYMIGIRNT